MPLSAVSFSDIDEAALQRLIDNGVQEGRNIDYKRDAVGNADAEKREFLKDISSFSNAAGGYLVIGMEEQEAPPPTFLDWRESIRIRKYSV